uniref:Ribonuclease P protein component n=1 Tax=Candidatus Kentrum sp. DK TaxID=2126562 RepID=A0A450TC91_9GAMM|nr:MAG: ribonuclease P protein component [Candidatus Kentron sp. DK]VFJ64417.1 MAG: ribonuclease P protein component [Candidatus Kentron sp. DK]
MQNPVIAKDADNTVNTASVRLPRHLRLRRKRDYARVFAEPFRSSDRTVTVLAIANGRDIPRLGLAISKRWLSRAVARNRIKRLIRESFRAHQDRLRGWDVVVISRSGITDVGAGMPSVDFFRALERHWDKIRSRRTRQRPCDAS